MKPSSLLALLFVGLSCRLLAAGEVDYLRDVKPIFAKHCYSCHGAKLQRAGLRLDTAELAIKGGTGGAVIEPGNSRDSVLVMAISGEEGFERMPKDKPPLAGEQIATIKAWIDGGAPAPENEQPQRADEVHSDHWSFQPIRRPELPTVRNLSWVRNPIDQFILARLESGGIAPSPEADRVTLIRRLSLDLLGLPPSRVEVDTFLADTRPDAYERLVDRLLESPHYGERWARHWLDAARYADSNGFNIDAPRSAWPYRDWVINALNDDMPFDEFTIEQIAGDMLPGATQSQIIATGFHRNTLLNQEGGIDVEQFRVESVVDRVGTTGSVFLGLTVGCAQCHDHKFDPLTQREFYELYAFLNNCDEPNLEIATPEELARRDAIRAQRVALEKERDAYVETLHGKQAGWESGLTADERETLKKEVRADLEIPADQRDDTQKQAVFEAFKTQDIGYRERQATIDALAKREPTFDTALVMHERDQPRESHVHIKGDFTRKGERVMPGVPAVLHPLPEGVTNPNRLDLARWLADPANPLTPRVTVNRIWQRYFGKGIVETENDFGTQGSPPTHPQLLDWLASEFIAQGWSLKAMHRLIVTSATYRQSSHARPELANLDPNNQLLARQNRLRLDAEIIRDSALAASGLLCRKIGGPSVHPPQPDGVMTLGQMRRSWDTEIDEDRYRRGLYTFFWRATPYPALMVFDAPDSTTACTRRNRSNTPLQALTLLNDVAFIELAQGLAKRVIREAPDDQLERIRYAFRLCLAREPRSDERQRLAELVDSVRSDFEAHPEAAAAAAVPKATSPGTDPDELATWTTVARVLLNLDEFITRE